MGRLDTYIGNFGGVRLLEGRRPKAAPAGGAHPRVASLAPSGQFTFSPSPTASVWDLCRGAPWGSRQDSDRCRWLGYPGAEVEPHQRQFLQPQGPVARREFRPATQILRAGNFSRVYRRTSPVMGSGESGPMGTKCPSAASPVAFWLLCRQADCQVKCNGL